MAGLQRHSALSLLLCTLVNLTATMALGRVVVLGARGSTGKLIVQHLVSDGAQVVAVARGAEPGKRDGVEWAPGDVTDAASIDKIIEGAEAVVFAAAASAGWRLGSSKATPPHVDYRGLRSVAEACVRHRIKRLVVVSSAFVTRPSHPIAILLNMLCGNILLWKRKGELAAIAAARREGSGLDVTVVRPGGLTNKPAQGPTWMQVGQGDQLSGLISREDVASAVVEAIRAQQTKGCVFEIVARKEERPQQKDWAAVFAHLQPNDGSYDPHFYIEEAVERKEL